MTVAVRGRVPRWATTPEAEQSAQHIQERLQALERALAGGAPTFLAPSVPIFGGGPVSGGGSGGGGGGGGGVTDHGALTGLADIEDHPQYVQQEQLDLGRPHQHGPDDLVGLDQRFIQRQERARPEAHSHVMSDVGDLKPDDMQFVIAARIYGGF